MSEKRRKARVAGGAPVRVADPRSLAQRTAAVEAYRRPALRCRSSSETITSANTRSHTRKAPSTETDSGGDLHAHHRRGCVVCSGGISRPARRSSLVGSRLLSRSAQCGRGNIRPATGDGVGCAAVAMVGDGAPAVRHRPQWMVMVVTRRRGRGSVSRTPPPRARRTTADQPPVTNVMAGYI
jgi:hypothetical protein